MKYNFKNTKTGEIIEKEFPMSEVPGEYTENDVKYVRDMGSEFKSSKPGFIIPRHMRAV